MPSGPLEHPGLRLIQAQIDQGELAHAQELLADLQDADALRHGASFLATRILFERGKLDLPRVIERLRDLLRICRPFPEAEAMLAAAESGTLTRSAEKQSATGSAKGAVIGEIRLASESLEALFRDLRPAMSLPSIPRAPGLPHFTPPPDLAPSYFPPQNSDSEPLPPPLPFALTHASLIGSATATETTHPPPSQIRSGPPPSFDAMPALSVIDIAALLDDGRYEEALENLDRASISGPDQQLLRARALHGAGRRKDAVAALDPLCNAPLLEPELRGSCARSLLELGELESALAQSERAHADEPDSLFLRVTLAWCKLRLVRRKGERRLVEEGEQLLANIDARNLPLPALVLALSACVQAHIGQPERAVRLAESALEHDSRSVDALWALGLAAARLDRPQEAKQAFLRLLNLSLGEARLLRRELSALGAPITDAPDGVNPEGSSFAFWHPLEDALVGGDRPRALVGFEQLCKDHLLTLHARERRDFEGLAAAAADYFTSAPVFHHFAPFDRSLWSIRRLAVALDLLCGTEPSATPTDDTPLIELVGAYLGDSLRRAVGGAWFDSGASLDSVLITRGERQWRPFELARARVRRGLALSVEDSLALEGLNRDAWQTREQTRASPPAPFGRYAWPEPDAMPQLGRAVSESVVALYCRQVLESPLDFSLRSLDSIDRYLALVAPIGAPLDDDPAWARRLAVLLGAYLGETLRRNAGGYWHHETCAPIDADAYVIVLADVSTATPVAQVMARVLGDTTSTVHEYVNEMLGGGAQG